MDRFIKKIPLINIPVMLLVILFLGKTSPLSAYIFIGLAFLSASAIFYKIRVDDYKKLVNPKRYLLIVTVLGLLISCILYFGFGRY